MANPHKATPRAEKPKAGTLRGTDLVRDRRGQVVPSVTAAELKNRTGAVLAGALSHGTVSISRHGEVHAVLLSADEYQALLKHAPSPAKALAKEFTQLVARMRSKRSIKGALSLFQASPEDLGRSAHKAAKPTRQGSKRR